MRTRTISFLVLSALLTVIVFQNPSKLTVKFFFWKTTFFTTGFLIASAVLTGILVTLVVFWYYIYKIEKQNKKLTGEADRLKSENDTYEEAAEDDPEGLRMNPSDKNSFFDA
jgi:uncharacterized integral membrane protein